MSDHLFYIFLAPERDFRCSRNAKTNPLGSSGWMPLRNASQSKEREGWKDSSIQTNSTHWSISRSTSSFCFSVHRIRLCDTLLTGTDGKCCHTHLVALLTVVESPKHAPSEIKSTSFDGTINSASCML